MQKILILFLKRLAHLLVCSDFEGSPNALWEALSLGVPSIVSNRVQEALFHLENAKNAIIIDGGSINALSNALSEVSKNKNLSKMLRDNGPKAVEKFSIAKINKKWDDILFGKIIMQVNKRPSILFVSGTLDIGGTEKHLSMILPELIKEGFDISIFIIGSPGKLGSIDVQNWDTCTITFWNKLN